MTKIFHLDGKIQNYAWGGTTYIPSLLEVKAENRKYAEYWLGAHVNAPSTVTTDDEVIKLDDLINANLEVSLGDEVAKRFGRLPFLFKILDVDDMLSIQVHPTKREAENGFKKENELGIPLTAVHRNYKDDNHKPEIMVALSEFWLLHGFLSKKKIIHVLETVPEFSNLLDVFYEGGYLGLYKKVMEQSHEETNLALRPLADRILPLYEKDGLSKLDPAYWAAKAIHSSEANSNIDKGIYSIYFFNIVYVNKGEAIFQDAGIPHAYLEGQNMELMANSDNVLRGGLTPKHVDVPELLKHVAFQETIPKIIKGEWQKDKVECIYKSPAPDFELSQIKLSPGEAYKGYAKSAQIIITIEGAVVVSEKDDLDIVLKKGQAIFIMANCDYSIIAKSNVVVYKATTP